MEIDDFFVKKGPPAPMSIFWSQKERISIFGPGTQVPGPMGPWAHGSMGPWANGPMGLFSLIGPYRALWAAHKGKIGQPTKGKLG